MKWQGHGLEQIEKLGKYQVQSILGEGGMGIVYKAYDPHLARVVAIKTIRRGLLDGKSGADLRERFSREARAEGRLFHPNIITIYEFQQDEKGTPFFVMEYVEGKDLKHYLSRGIRFDLEKTLHIVEQVLSALAHSHSEGVVHRDIKPANIILLENDTVKIADFGIARMEESEFTQTGMVMGTPQYISPEQRLGHRVDARTDLYSTGAVMYELLTGQKASPDLSAKTLWSRITDTDTETTKLDTTDAKTRRIFHTVVVKALAKDPDDRFASAQEFRQAIADARPTPDPGGNRRPRGLWLGLIAGIAVMAAAYFLSIPGQEKAAAKAALPLEIDKAADTRRDRLSDEELRKLQSQLRVAKTHMLVGRLISPSGSNALHSYRLVLEIDPGNAEARQGVASVQDKLLVRIEQSISSGDYQRADEELSLGLQKFPASSGLLALRGQLE